jgi:DNA-binding response OmpR family regulator
VAEERRLLLAGGDRRPRALVLAELVEAGYDVTAVETWNEAELLLRERSVRPSAVVFDLEGETNAEASLVTLARLVPVSQCLVLVSAATPRAEKVRSLGFEHVLARPYSVGDVVCAVERLTGRQVPGSGSE